MANKNYIFKWSGSQNMKVRFNDVNFVPSFNANNVSMDKSLTTATLTNETASVDNEDTRSNTTQERPASNPKNKIILKNQES